MKKLFSTLLVGAFLFAGCTSTSSQPTSTVAPTINPATNSEQAPTGKIAGFTASDIAAHNTESDCWVSIDGKVYDLSTYLNQHPGGAEVIIKDCGKDASESFHTMDGKGKDHSPKATEMLKNYYKGLLQ